MYRVIDYRSEDLSQDFFLSFFYNNDNQALSIAKFISKNVQLQITWL